MLKDRGVIVHDFQAEIGAERHGEAGLQKVAVALAKAIFANEKYNDRHNGGNCKLRNVLVVAAFYEALLDGAAVVKYNPVPHEECYHEDADDN